MRGAALSAALALTACVPASEARPPAGAGGLNVTPSAAGRGESFVNGSWTITVEKFVAQASVSAMRESSGTDGDYYGYGGGSAEWIFEVRAAPVIFAPGTPIGPARVHASLHGQYISNESHGSDEHITIVGASAEDVQRMHEKAVVPPSYLSSNQFYDYAYGPSVLLRMRGERDDGEHIVVDLEIVAQNGLGGASYSSGNWGALVDIRANSLSVGIMDVALELLFDSSFPFQDIADADADRSGTVTSAELQAVKAIPKAPPGVPSSAYAPSYTQSLLDTLGSRLTGLVFRIHS